ncbi:phage tail tape measure protein [Atopobiaceae bacterium 24-176]
MADAYKGLYIEFKGDATKLNEALAQVRRKSREANKELAQLDKALKFDPKSTALLSERVKSATRAVGQATEKVNALKQAQAEVGAGTDAYGRISRELAIAEAYLKKSREELIRFTEAATPLGRAAASIKEFGEGAVEAGEKIKGVGSAISGIGDSLTTSLTVPIAAAATASVVAAVDIDTAWYGVRKTVDATEEQYEQLKESAIELSKQQPISAETILNIEELGGQLGIVDESTTDLVGTLEDFAMVAGGLDIATNLNAEEAATKLAQFKNITKMSNDELSNFASALVDLGNHSATTEADILEMATRIASAGESAHMSEADILGLSTALSSTGMNADAGGSAISTVIKNIANACDNYERALDGTMHGTQAQMDKTVWMMEGLAEVTGMTVDEFRQAWSEDAAGALTDFLVKANEMGDAGESLNTLFTDLGISEIRQSDAMRRLAGNSDLVIDSVNRANTAWTENTALTDEVGARNESLASRFEVLKNRVIAVAEQIGKPVAEALLDVVDAAEPLIKVVTDAAQGFADMGKSEQQAVLKAVALVAAVGPVTSLLGRVVSTTGSAVVGIGKFAQGIGGAVGRVNGFGTALTTTNPHLINAYRATGTWSDKLAVALNRSKGAANGLNMLSGAYAKTSSKAGPFVDSLSKERSALASATKNAGGYKAMIASADTASGKFVGGTVTLTGSMTKQVSAVDRASQAFAGLVGAIGTIGAVVSIAAVVTEVADAVHKAAIGYDEAADAARAASAASSEFVDSFSGVQGAAVDLDLALSSSGSSISGLQGVTREAFGNIVAIVQRDMAEAGYITEQGAADIEENFQRILDATAEKTGAYVNQLQAIPKRFESLDSSSVGQYVADVGTVFEQGKQDVESTLNDMLAVIESKHRAAGTLDSEAYRQDVERAQQAAEDALSVLEQERDKAVQLTAQKFGEMGEETEKGWDKLEEYGRTGMAAWKLLLKDGFPVDPFTQAQVEKEFNELAASIDQGATAAWLAAQAATVAAGGPLTEASRQNVEDIVNAFDDLPDFLQDEAEGILRPLAESIEAGGIELGDVGSMTAQQLVDAIRSKLLDGSSSVREGADGILEALRGFGDDVRDSLQTDGIGFEDLTGKLLDVGVTAEQMRGITADAFSSMVAEAGGDIDRLVELIQKYNENPVEDQNAQISITSDVEAKMQQVGTFNDNPVRDQNAVVNVDTGEVVIAEGVLGDYNENTHIDDKNGAVTVDHSSLDTAGAKVSEWMASPADLGAKYGSATAEYRSVSAANSAMGLWQNLSMPGRFGVASATSESVSLGNDRMQRWNGLTMPPRSGLATAQSDTVETGNRRMRDWRAIGSLQTYQGTTRGIDEGLASALTRARDFSALPNLISKTFETVHKAVNWVVNKVTGEHASGGIVGPASVNLHADGGIRRHASGAIARYSAPLDVVGEAGAEAIVPLSNRIYAMPFVRMIAEETAREMRAASGERVVRVEVVQNNKVVRSGSDLDSAMQVINRSMLSAAREVFR